MRGFQLQRAEDTLTRRHYREAPTDSSERLLQGIGSKRVCSPATYECVVKLLSRYLLGDGGAKVNSVDHVKSLKDANKWEDFNSSNHRMVIGISQGRSNGDPPVLFWMMRWSGIGFACSVSNCLSHFRPRVSRMFYALVDS